MTAIKVCREPDSPGECRNDDDALNWGGDISDILLSTDEAAIERGRIEIDRQYTNRINSTIALHQTTFIQPGNLIAVSNVDKIETGRMGQGSISVIKSDDSLTVGSEIIMEKNV